MTDFIAIATSGCLACWRNCPCPIEEAIHKYEPVHGDIHHLVENGRRLKGEPVISLCPFHHRGIRPEWIPDLRHAERVLGPSLAINKKDFHDRYGSNTNLLAFQKKLLDLFYRKV